MRQPRRETLVGSGIFHKMWRGHNREAVLEGDVEKKAYLKHLRDTYTDDIKKTVQWHSYCLMNNHPHETGRVLHDDEGELDGCVHTLGNWMRNAHSRFGSEYNRRHNRQGKVAYDRPKTKEVGDEEGLLQVMFYGDANPMRAGLVSHPSHYRFSSHRFYAYGEKTEDTKCLTLPPAYLELGKTPEQRQKRYRQLCDLYLRNAGLIKDRPNEEVSEPIGDLVDSTPQAKRKAASLPLARGDPMET